MVWRTMLVPSLGQKLGFTQGLSRGKLGLTQKLTTETFGGRLQRARKIAGKSRDEVATAAGVSEHTVGAWERGDEINPTMASLAGMSYLLGVSVDWLIHGPRVTPKLQTSVPVPLASDVADDAADDL